MPQHPTVHENWKVRLGGETINQHTFSALTLCAIFRSWNCMHLRWLPWLLVGGDTTCIENQRPCSFCDPNFRSQSVVFARMPVNHRKNSKPLQIWKFVCAKNRIQDEGSSVQVQECEPDVAPQPHRNHNRPSAANSLCAKYHSPFLFLCTISRKIITATKTGKHKLSTKANVSIIFAWGLSGEMPIEM